MSPVRLKLTFLFATTGVAAICVATYACFAPRPLPILTISCEQPWSVASSRNTVAFVDADFNGFTNFHADTYEEFCHWFRGKYKRNAILIDTTPGAGETWNKLQKSWRKLGISTGAYKTFGGAGQVIWIENGVVVASAFLPDSDFDKLKQRTLDTF